MLKRPLLASAIIAVCMKRQEEGKIEEIEEIEAVACAIQNMHLTCTAYGIGGFWSTPKLIYHSKMNDFLGLSENDKCLGLFYLGYPAIEWPESHRKPLEYNTEWRNQ
jgi:nitroreductase